MRKATKLLTLVLAALMIMSVVSINASAFEDVSVENAALNDAVELLSTLGVAKGTTDKTFGPDELVTRQQMAAFVFRLMKAGKSMEGGVNETPFTDLDDSTFYYMISWASQNGIIKGRNATTFDPKGNIVLQDAYVMLVRALGYEKESTLPYPFGYIDQAEALGLDENLPSTLNYGDKLTRGDVAIILANAFYADMNEKEVKYDWKVNQTYGTAQWVGEEVTATVASKVFGVEEQLLKVHATTHFGAPADKLASAGAATLNASTNTALYNENKDIDELVGVRYNKKGELLTAVEETFEMDKLIGLDGKSDDYFLAEITLFVKPGATHADDVIVAAKSNLVKKTVTAKDVVIGRSTRSEDKYFINEDDDLAQIMTGYIDFGGIKAYVNNAPTSYKNLKPNGTKATAKFFTLSTVGATEETFTYNGATAIAEKYLQAGAATTGSKNGYDALDEYFATNYKEIYYGGLYEADVYDVDGDGFAEYVNVKPYRMVTIDEQNKSYYFIERDNAEATTGSTKKDSILIKGEFTYGKPVLAYYPNNNYMEVKETLTPVKSYVARQKSVTGDMSVTSTAAAGTEYTLQSGEVISTLYANEKYGHSVGSLSASSAAIITVYAKDGVLLYTNSTSYGNFDANANYAYIIPYKLASDPTNTTGQDMMLYEAQGVVGGKVVSSFFVNAIIDGKKQAVALGNTITTKIKATYNNGSWSYNTESSVISTKITEKVVAEYVLANAFKYNFATFTVTEDGKYVFTDPEIQTNYSTVLNSTTLEDSAIVNFGTVTIEYFSPKVYNVGSNAAGITRLMLNANSKVIVKTIEDNEAVYTVYTADTLPKFDLGSTFNNVKGIIVNNKYSQINNNNNPVLETVGILYAEAATGSIGAIAKQDYYIVTGTATGISAEKGAINYVNLINIKTGEVKNDVVVVTGTTLNKNNVAVITDDGKAKDKAVAGSYSRNILFKETFVNYDKGSNFLDLGDNNDYVLADDVTILYYNGTTNKYEVSDKSILDATPNNAKTELQDGFFVYVVADQDATTTLKVVSTIVVSDTVLS